MNVELREGERIDDLQNGYSVIQHPDDFCFGCDAVLLAHFATVRHKARAVDLCSGSGIIPVLMAAHTDASHITGVELQPHLAERAERSVMLNGLSERVAMCELDLKYAPDALGRNVYDLVTCNPPYGKAGSSFPSADEAKLIARHEVMCTLEDCVRSASALVKNGGRAAFVVPPLRAAELMGLFYSYRLTPKRLQSAAPKAGAVPFAILIEGVKGGKDALEWLPPIYMEDDCGAPTEKVRRIYAGERTDRV